MAVKFEPQKYFHVNFFFVLRNEQLCINVAEIMCSGSLCGALYVSFMLIGLFYETILQQADF